MKVASTENGVIFSTISYDVRGSTSDRNCVYLQDIKIDIMVSCPLGFKNKINRGMRCFMFSFSNNHRSFQNLIFMSVSEPTPCGVR